jgi:hypothetical protein
MMDPVKAVLADLAVFDTADVAAGVGALQLVPENADHLLRLERLAGVVAALSEQASEGRPRMSAGRWRSLINSPPIADAALVSAEDSFEEPYTESIAFFGGSYTVMAGLATGSVRIARRITEAIFQMEPAMDLSFSAECSLLTRSVLSLSKVVTTRGGLPRGVAPVPGKGRPAVVPAADTFARLKRAVRLTGEELEHSLGVDLSRSLQPFLVQPGDLPPPELDREPSDRLVATPILDFSTEVVVVVPTALLAALRHRIIVRAAQLGLDGALAERYRKAVERNVLRSLWMMDFAPIDLDVSAPPGEFGEHFLRFDESKVAHLLVVTDPLTSYDTEDPFGFWPDDGLSASIEARIVAVRHEIRALRGPSTGVLHIVVLDGVGRSVNVGLADGATADRAYPVILTSDDLEIIARLELGDPLALWKFAKAADALRSRTDVLHFSTLDEYSIYRSHEHSFYLGDDRPPTFLSIAPGVSHATPGRRHEGFRCSWCP